MKLLFDITLYKDYKGNDRYSHDDIVRMVLSSEVSLVKQDGKLLLLDNKSSKTIGEVNTVDTFETHVKSVKNLVTTTFDHIKKGKKLDNVIDVWKRKNSIDKYKSK